MIAETKTVHDLKRGDDVLLTFKGGRKPKKALFVKVKDDNPEMVKIWVYGSSPQHTFYVERGRIMVHC